MTKYILNVWIIYVLFLNQFSSWDEIFQMLILLRWKKNVENVFVHVKHQ